MLDQFTTTQLLAAAAVFAIVVITTVALFITYRRTRTRAFRSRFGPANDRADPTHGSSRKAKAELADRETDLNALKLRDLDVSKR